MLWYENKIKGVALSTRVRLARNLDSVPFPSALSLPELKSTSERIADAVLKCQFNGVKLRRIDMETLGEIEIYSMVERHIISPQFAAKTEGRILLLSDDESISIMIGEEDHLRIQVIKSGLCLKEAYSICDMLDTKISEVLTFAFDERLGFLTECPTNLGTGMRASVMLHLPVLYSSGELKTIADTVSKIGLTFRGFYGEGSNSAAHIYQLSNQITLGVSEEGALENLNNIATQIIEKESDCFSKLDKEAFEDGVFRSFGILKYAKKLTTDEMMKHISMLMLGERMGLITLPKTVVPMNMFITSQPAMINRIHGELAPNERDKIRAESIRNVLKSVDI